MAEEKLTLITPKLQHDQPVEPSREQVEFNFNAYANTFARLITATTTRTPLVILVSGDWGSGKTTLLKTIQGKVAETTAKPINQISYINPGSDDEVRLCRTVWFNAWKYSTEESLLAALIRAILAEMNKGSWKDNWKAKLDSKTKDPFFPRRDVLATFLGMFHYKLADTDSGFEFTPDVNAYKTETPFAKNKAFFDDFREVFEQLLAAWVGEKGALVVFIDDLDRCLPEKVAQVLETIKLFLDQDGVVFVLAADERAVQAAVTSHYKKSEINEQRANDYLEKMFQVRFPLPPLSEPQVKAYLGAGLDIPDPYIRENVKLLVAGAEANPRQLKTFINDLEMGWAMLANSGQAAGIERADFIYWLALRRVGARFCEKVQKLPLESRLTYIQKASKRFNGDTTEAEEFKEWDGFEHQRLRDVLRLVSFSEKVTPERLSQIIFFSTIAVPVVETPPPNDEKVKVYEVTGTIQASAAIRSTVDVQAILAKPFVGEYWAEIPAGKFVMGSRDDDQEAYDNERPQHTLELPTFRIARYPITNAQYEVFVKAEKVGWIYPNSGEDHPAVNINWENAVAFCVWLTKELQISGILSKHEAVRLPTEAEWEKAARGEFGRKYPWGDKWDMRRCNSAEGGRHDTTPVGSYSALGGDSPYGVADMAGNIWEWCSTSDLPYPYNVSDGRENLDFSYARVQRGGAYYEYRDRCRATSRDGRFPTDAVSQLVGFRVCTSPVLHAEL